MQNLNFQSLEKVKIKDVGIMLVMLSIPSLIKLNLRTKNWSGKSLKFPS